MTVHLHVELVHPDPDAAADFMVETLGARRVEEKLASFLSSAYPDLKIVHVAVGEVVFQIVKPSASENHASWRGQLEREGPGVHNVAIMVDDVHGVRDRLVDAGAHEERKYGGISFAGSGLDEPEPKDAYLIDAREQSGLRIELLENVPAWTPGEAP
jgi:catechol 2,3-dioxygenase-like lactoylglutathione lyase family enzyme